MGACVSKCYTNPCANLDPRLLEEKHVISDSPPFNSHPSAAPSESHTTPSSFSAASLSSSSSSSSPSVSSSNSTSCSSSGKSSYLESLSKDEKSSNEKLLTSGKDNSQIVVLDPQKHGPGKPKPVRCQVQPLQPASRTARGPATKPPVRNNQSFPAKRARSNSPNTLRKSSRTEGSSAVAAQNRNLSCPPTPWRSTGAQIERQMHRVGIPGNAVPCQNAARKDNIRPSGPKSSSDRRSSNIEKETFVHHIHQGDQPRLSHNGSREFHSGQASRVPLIEDLSNPLISLDCFIFI